MLGKLLPRVGRSSITLHWEDMGLLPLFPLLLLLETLFTKSSHLLHPTEFLFVGHNNILHINFVVNVKNNTSSIGISTIDSVWRTRGNNPRTKCRWCHFAPRNFIVSRDIVNPSLVANGPPSVWMDLEGSLRKSPALSVDLNLPCNLLVGKLKTLGIEFVQEIKERFSNVSEENDERIVELCI